MVEVVEYLRTVARASARSRSEQWAEAAALWAQVVERNPVNGNHWDRLAEARFGAGDYQGALAAYEKVLELGVWERRRETVFPAEVVYRMACCHARLGDRKRALEALAEALERGYRDLERLRSDDHLASLRDEQRFGELAGPDPHEVEGLPRDQGWRGDLRLLAREVKRRASIPLRGFPERRFDAAVEDLSRSVPELSDTQIAVELMKLLRPLGDGHASVEVPEENQDFHRALPLQFYLFEEGMFVTAAEPAHAPLLGAQLLHLDQHPLDEVIATLEPLISRDNQQWPKQVAPMLLRQLPLLHALGVVADPGAVSLTVRRADGTTGAVTSPPARPCPRRRGRRGRCPVPPAGSSCRRPCRPPYRSTSATAGRATGSSTCPTRAWCTSSSTASPTTPASRWRRSAGGCSTWSPPTRSTSW